MVAEWVVLSQRFNIPRATRPKDLRSVAFTLASVEDFSICSQLWHKIPLTVFKFQEVLVKCQID
jgi:hypothetical protein